MLQDKLKKGQMTFFYIDRKIPYLKKITWVYVTVYYLLPITYYLLPITYYLGPV